MDRRQAFGRLFYFSVAAFAIAWAPWFAVMLIKDTSAKLALIGLFAPAIAALTVAGATGGWREVRSILERFTSVRVGAAWWLFALLLMPAVYAMAAFAVGDRQSIHLLAPPNSWWFLLLSFLYLLVITAGEEIGWRGYALPLMLAARVPPVLAAIALGIAWGAWHLPLRGASGLTNFPLPLFLLFTTLLSIMYMAIFQQTGGGLIPALLLHASTDFAPRVIDISRLAWPFWAIVSAVLALTAIALCAFGCARQPAR